MALFQASRRVLRPAQVSLARFCATASTQQAGQAGQGVAPPTKHGFNLGPANALSDVPAQGWQFDTRCGPSSIAQAGDGRFAKEFVKAGQVVIRKVLMPMAKIDSLLGIPNDVTITFSTEAELEKYIDLAFKEGGHSREEVLFNMEHFIYGFDGKVGCLNVSTWTVNHGHDIESGLNVDVQPEVLPGGGLAYSGTAMQDINVGDEFYMDYRKFALPEFYREFAKKHNYKDVREATVTAVYGSNVPRSKDFLWGGEKIE